MWDWLGRSSPHHSARDDATGTIRTAQLIGFGLTLTIWLVIGYLFTQRMADVERQSRTLNARYLHGQELLTAVRTQVLIGSIYVRDALLDPDPSSVREYRDRLAQSYRSADEALRQYEPIFDDPAETRRITRLRGELEGFRNMLDNVLAPGDDTWRSHATAALRAEIVPRREMVIRVSDEAQALNRAAFVEQRSKMSELYRDIQTLTWKSFGLAVGASLIVGLVTLLHVGRIEHRLRQQQVQDARNVADLQQVSAKLIRAQEAERRNIARELHDQVGQVLTTIKVELAVAQRSLAQAGGPSHALDDVKTIADSGLAMVRDLSRSLHPSLLEDLGLVSAIEWSLTVFGQRHNLRVVFTREGVDEPLNREIEASAYRVVQEALNNIGHHAHATSCCVSMKRAGDALLICIEDDGFGFDPSAEIETSRRGLGLVSMRERVAEMRGRFTVDSAPGTGTRITAEFPIGAHQQADGTRPVFGGAQTTHA